MASFLHFVSWILVVLCGLVFFSYRLSRPSSEHRSMPELEALVRSIPVDKDALRLRMKQLRKERAAAEQASEMGNWFSYWQHRREQKRLSQKLLHALRMLPPRTIAGYIPMPGEADIRHALVSLHHLGWKIVLPCVEDDGKQLRFRQWKPQDELITGPYGIRQPDPFAPEALPQQILVPMLGFDTEGNRLGMGAGWYDRTLATLHAQEHFPELIGIAYDEQEIPRIPAQPHDQPMDRVVTPTRILNCRFTQ